MLKERRKGREERALAMGIQMPDDKAEETPPEGKGRGRGRGRGK